MSTLDLDAIEATLKTAKTSLSEAEIFAACTDITLTADRLLEEIRFLRSIRDNQAAVIRKQAREIDALRYDRDQALARESEERAARIAAEELAKPLKVREVLP